MCAPIGSSTWKSRIRDRARNPRPPFCSATPAPMDTLCPASRQSLQPEDAPAGSPFPELQRRPGAGCLVGSSTIQDHLAVTRNLVLPLLELLRKDAERTGQDRMIDQRLQRVAQVDDHHLLSRIDPLQELFRLDPFHRDLPNELLPLPTLESDIARGYDHEEHQPQQPFEPSQE